MVDVYLIEEQGKGIREDRVEYQPQPEEFKEELISNPCM